MDKMPLKKWFFKNNFVEDIFSNRLYNVIAMPSALKSNMHVWVSFDAQLIAEQQALFRRLDILQGGTKVYNRIRK